MLPPHPRDVHARPTAQAGPVTSDEPIIGMATEGGQSRPPRGQLASSVGRRPVSGERPPVGIRHLVPR